MTPSDRKYVNNLIKHLDCTEAEAIEIMRYDKEVDRLSNFDFNSTMTEEEKEAITMLTSTTSGIPSVYNFPSKERKIDNTKVELIGDIAYFLEEKAENVQIIKAEREISFEIEDELYSITLTKHRKPKKKA